MLAYYIGTHPVTPESIGKCINLQNEFSLRFFQSIVRAIFSTVNTLRVNMLPQKLY